MQAEEARRSGDRPFGALLVDGLAGAVLFEAKDTVRVKAQQQQPKRLRCACVLFHASVMLRGKGVVPATLGRLRRRPARSCRDERAAARCQRKPTRDAVGALRGGQLGGAL